jgi:hypothetical protein
MSIEETFTTYWLVDTKNEHTVHLIVHYTFYPGKPGTFDPYTRAPLIPADPPSIEISSVTTGGEEPEDPSSLIPHWNFEAAEPILVDRILEHLRGIR